MDSTHLLNAGVALDALLKGSDLQQHVLELNGRLARLNAIHGFGHELSPETLTRKVRALGDRIIGDLKAVQTLTTHLENILSGQDPFPPAPRRRHRNTPPSPPLSTTPEEE